MGDYLGRKPPDLGGRPIARYLSAAMVTKPPISRWQQATLTSFRAENATIILINEPGSRKINTMKKLWKIYARAKMVSSWRRRSRERGDLDHGPAQPPGPTHQLMPVRRGLICMPMTLRTAVAACKLPRCAAQQFRVRTKFTVSMKPALRQPTVFAGDRARTVQAQQAPGHSDDIAALDIFFAIGRSLVCAARAGHTEAPCDPARNGRFGVPGVTARS